MELQTELNSENFDQTIQQSNRPVFVTFWASWSTASLMNMNYLEETDNLIGHRIYMTSIDIELEPVLSERFSIITVPTTLIFWQGEIVKQYIGIQEAETYKQYIDTLLGPDPEEEEKLTE